MSCEFCKASTSLYSANHNGTHAEIYIMGSALTCDLHIDYATVYIKFCPMCGELVEEPRPLEPEQLKQMIGKPVYIVDDDEPTNNGWTIWTQHHNEYWLDIPGNGECCGTIWKAYTHKPKEAQTDA